MSQPEDPRQKRADELASAKAYRSEHYDELEMSGSLNRVDAYIEMHEAQDNQLIVMWAAKGGAGTTVTAAAAALHATRSVLLVDLAGDAAAVLGLREHELGVRAWLASDAEPDRLIEFTDQIDDTTKLIQAGTADPERGIYRPDRLTELATWLKQQPGTVIVDAGTGPPPPELYFEAQRNILVTRADYLALTAASRAMLRPDEVFVVNEPGRVLTHDDIERAVHAPVTGSVDLEPATARAIDAGLFIGHANLNRATSHLTAPDGKRSFAAEPTHGPAGPDVDYGMQWTGSDNSHTFRLNYDPTTQELAFVDNMTNDRHSIAHYESKADVDEALAGWATHHADTANGLHWVQGATMDPPEGITELMQPPAIGTDTPPPSDLDLGIGL